MGAFTSSNHDKRSPYMHKETAGKVQYSRNVSKGKKQHQNTPPPDRKRPPLSHISGNEHYQLNNQPPICHGSAIPPYLIYLRDTESTKFQVITIMGDTDKVEVRQGARPALTSDIPPNTGITQTHSFHSASEAVDFATQLVLDSIKEGFTEGTCPRCRGPGPEKESEWEICNHQCLCHHCGIEWIGGG